METKSLRKWRELAKMLENASGATRQCYHVVADFDEADYENKANFIIEKLYMHLRLCLFELHEVVFGTRAGLIITPGRRNGKNLEKAKQAIKELDYNLYKIAMAIYDSINYIEMAHKHQGDGVKEHFRIMVKNAERAYKAIKRTLWRLYTALTNKRPNYIVKPLDKLPEAWYNCIKN